MPDLSMVFDLLARDRASSEVSKVGDSMDRAGDRADGLGDRVSGMFDTLTVAAAGAGLAVGAAFMDTLEREAGTRTLTAQLGLDPAESAAAGELAGDLYADNYGDSLGTVNDAVGAVASSLEGLGPIGSDAMQEATRDALNFATAFGTDVNESVGLVGNLITNGLVPDASAGFDLLTAAYQRVPAAMRDELPAILTEYGTNFRALGFSGEQAIGLLASAAEQGPFVLDKMGDALKELTIRGTDMSKASVTAYDAVGLSADDMAAKLVAGGSEAQSATQQIAQSLLDMQDPVERANAAIGLFGTPLEDLSVDQIPAFLESIARVGPGMTDAAGAADALDATLSSGIGPRLETLKRGAMDAVNGGMTALIAGFSDGKTGADGWQGGLRNLAATIGGTLGPPIEWLADFLQDPLGPGLEGVFGYLADHQTTVTVIAGLISGVLAAAFLVWGARAMLAAGQNVVAWFTAVSAARSGATSQQLSALQVVASWSLMAARATLHALRVSAVWIAQTLWAGTTMVAGWTVAAAGTLASWALMGAQALAAGVRIAAVWAAQTALTVGPMMLSWGILVATVVGGWALMGVQSLIRAAQMAAAWFIALGPVGWIIAVVVGLVALIIANWDKVKAFTIGAFHAIVGVVVGATHAIVDEVSSGVSSVVSFVSGLPGKIVSALAGFGSLLRDLGGDLLRGLWEGISGSTDWLMDKVGGFFGDLLPGWVKDMLGISSPSRVFAAFGRDSMRGFAVGIDEGTGGAIAAAERAAAAVAAAGAGVDMGGGYGSGSLGYSPPGYDMGAGPAAGAGGVTHRTIVSGVVGPEEVAAIVRRDQQTTEFLAGAGLP
jgi:hypothetical protein